MSLNDVEIAMDISIVQPKSAIHTWIYPWMCPWIHLWIHPWISISTATLVKTAERIKMLFGVNTLGGP